MQQTLEKMITYGYSLWRYRWYAVAMAWVIVLAGWAIILRMPEKYTAETLIHVDTANILKPLLKGLVLEEDIGNQQLNLMTQLLTSRPNLNKVAEAVRPNHQTQDPEQLEFMVSRLKQDISIEGSKTNPTATALDLYHISYVDGDPELAKKVIQELIATFTEQFVNKNRRDSEMAKQFLEQQISEYEEKLTEAETRLREFKRQHIDVLPEQQRDFFTRLQALQSQTEDIGLRILEAESQRKALEQQLAGTPAGQRATSTEGAPILTPTESRILNLQRRLDELLLTYTDSHPDVIATKYSIAELEIKREAELKELSNSTSSAAVANPEYQQLRLKLGETVRDLAALRARQEEFRRRIQSLQQQRETLPVIEAELQRLNRNYETDKERYNNLVGRREAIKLAGDVQQTNEDIKFEVVEAPRVLTWKAWKQRLILITGILAAGLGGGLMLAFILSKLHPVIYSRHSLSELTGLPVFGVIPQTLDSSIYRRKHLELTGFVLVSLLILIAYGYVLFLQFSNIGLAGILQALRGAG